VGIQRIKRNGGKLFLWKQIHMQPTRIRIMYGAMWDELSDHLSLSINVTDGELFSV